jgi:hypothetical protein
LNCHRERRKCVTTDEAASMVGKKRGLMFRTGKKTESTILRVTPLHHLPKVTLWTDLEI